MKTLTSRLLAQSLPTTIKDILETPKEVVIGESYRVHGWVKSTRMQGKGI